MFELVKGKLIYGESYYVKTFFYNYDGIFDGYNDVFKNFAWFKITNYNQLNEVYQSYELIEINNIFYRHVSKKEYYEKIKEKYDAKCLNIVLKRLVNETFE
jgi:hypothetical protein